MGLQSIVPANDGSEDVRQMASTWTPADDELDEELRPCCMAMLAKEVDFR